MLLPYLIECHTLVLDDNEVEKLECIDIDSSKNIESFHDFHIFKASKNTYEHVWQIKIDTRHLTMTVVTNLLCDLCHSKSEI